MFNSEGRRSGDDYGGSQGQASLIAVEFGIGEMGKDQESNWGEIN